MFPCSSLLGLSFPYSCFLLVITLFYPYFSPFSFFFLLSCRLLSHFLFSVCPFPHILLTAFILMFITLGGLFSLFLFSTCYYTILSTFLLPFHYPFFSASTFIPVFITFGVYIPYSCFFLLLHASFFYFSFFFLLSFHLHYYIHHFWGFSSLFLLFFSRYDTLLSTFSFFLSFHFLSSTFLCMSSSSLLTATLFLSHISFTSFTFRHRSLI